MTRVKNKHCLIKLCTYFVVKGEVVDEVASSIDSLAGGLPVDGTANQNPAEDLCFTAIEDTQQCHGE